jgi:hypothetical protein
LRAQINPNVGLSGVDRQLLLNLRLFLGRAGPHERLRVSSAN